MITAFMKYITVLLRTFFFFLLVSITYRSSAQSNDQWQKAGTLYSDNYITVDLEFRFSKRVCDPQTSKLSRWRYVITNLSRRGKDFWLNWKMDYINCTKQVIRLTNSYNIGRVENEGTQDELDWEFPGDSLFEPVSKQMISVSNTPDNSKPIEINVVRTSVAPTGIKGVLNIIPGVATSLTQENGVLALGARWVWYKDVCGGTPISEGSSVVVRPQATTTYFVRAEGNGKNSSCTQTTVIVDDKSQAAAHIDGSDKICAGKGTQLKVVGGKLGVGANWYWFENSCDSNAIGQGESIYVSPLKDATYFVKAKGQANTTTCVSFRVNVISGFNDPLAINAPSAVCANEAVQLSVSPNSSSNAQWVWYENNLNSTVKYYGQSITAFPKSTTTYYVRAEGACESTKAISVEIIVKAKSIAPVDISGPGYLQKNRSATFTPNGGSLGEHAEWLWYVNTLSKKPVYKGNSFTGSFRNATTLILRAEGECNLTATATKSITVYKKTQQVFFNVGVVGTGLDDLKNIGEKSTVAVTVAYKDKIGVYARIKFGLTSIPASQYKTDDTKITNYFITNNYYKYNGASAVNRFGATAGTVLGGKNIYFYIGAGYGSRKLLWGIDELALQGGTKTNTSWATHDNRSISGIEGEAGVILRLGFIHIMGGVNAIYKIQQVGASVTNSLKNFYDGTIGVGFNF